MTSTAPLRPAETARIERDPYLDALVEEAHAHRALHHPWVRALADDGLPDLGWAVRDFAWQYNAYSSRFTHYLRAVIRGLERDDHRALLEQNLLEEQGHLDPDERAEIGALGIDPDTVDGVPHSVLFRQFCKALGLSPKALTRPGDAGVRWRERFEGFLENATPAAAVGALGLGTEHIVRPLYEQLLAGIERTELDREDYVFFELHCHVDDQHQLDLYSIARDLAHTPEGRRDLRRGMLEALDLRSEFFDRLYARAVEGRQEVSA